MLKAIIFDFDGVLANTFNVYVETLKEKNTNISGDDLIEVQKGNPYQKSPFFKTKEDYEDFFDKTKNKLTRDLLFPLKEEIIELSKEYKLFIVSSTREDNIEKFLEDSGMIGYFEVIYGLNAGRYKTEKFQILFENNLLNNKECLFVTDTLGDIREANEVGLPTVAVTWGYHDFATLQKGEPWKIISEFEELIPTIEEYKVK